MPPTSSSYYETAGTLPQYARVDLVPSLYDARDFKEVVMAHEARRVHFVHRAHGGKRISTKKLNDAQMEFVHGVIENAGFLTFEDSAKMKILLSALFPDESALDGLTRLGAGGDANTPVPKRPVRMDVFIRYILTVPHGSTAPRLRGRALELVRGMGDVVIENTAQEYIQNVAENFGFYASVSSLVNGLTITGLAVTGIPESFASIRTQEQYDIAEMAVALFVTASKHTHKYIDTKPLEVAMSAFKKKSTLSSIGTSVWGKINAKRIVSAGLSMALGYATYRFVSNAGVSPATDAVISAGLGAGRIVATGAASGTASIVRSVAGAALNVSATGISMAASGVSSGAGMAANIAVAGAGAAVERAKASAPTVDELRTRLGIAAAPRFPSNAVPAASPAAPPLFPRVPGSEATPPPAPSPPEVVTEEEEVVYLSYVEKLARHLMMMDVLLTTTELYNLVRAVHGDNIRGADGKFNKSLVFKSVLTALRHAAVARLGETYEAGGVGRGVSAVANNLLTASYSTLWDEEMVVNWSTLGNTPGGRYIQHAMIATYFIVAGVSAGVASEEVVIIKLAEWLALNFFALRNLVKTVSSSSSSSSSSHAHSSSSTSHAHSSSSSHARADEAAIAREVERLAAAANLRSASDRDRELKFAQKELELAKRELELATRELAGRRKRKVVEESSSEEEESSSDSMSLVDEEEELGGGGPSATTTHTVVSPAQTVAAAVGNDAISVAMNAAKQKHVKLAEKARKAEAAEAKKAAAKEKAAAKRAAASAKKRAKTEKEEE